jgi:L-iditol 2-dehydrogenase
MKAAFLKTMNDIILRDIRLWELEDDEIRIKVDACGICGTDVTAACNGNGDYAPFGHEVAGTILEMGRAVRNLEIGQEVALESASACGRCLNCRDARQELCTDKKSFFYKTSFGFAEEMIAPAISAIPYQGIAPEEACASEPLAVAIDMHRLADIQIGSHVVVSGLGCIGLMALRLARLSGAERIYGCDHSSARIRLERAREFGADEIIEIDKTALENFRFEEPPDRFMISSPPRTLVPAMRVAAKGAVISFIGIEYGEGANVCFDANDFHFKKLQLRASFASPALYTPKALDLLQKRIIDARTIITHSFPLAEVGTAVEYAARRTGEAIKVVVKP